MRILLAIFLLTFAVLASDHTAYDRGVAAFEAKNYETAIKEFTEAIKNDPNFAGAYAYRGDAYSGLDDPEKAIADFTQAIKLNPNNAVATFAYYNRGRAYINSDKNKAIADFTQAIKLDPKYTLAYHDRGATYSELKDYKKAIADFTQAIKVAAVSSGEMLLPFTYSARASVYRELKDHKKAIADLTQAIKLDPKYTLAYNDRGATYSQLKDHGKAIADFTQAIKLDPKHASAYYNRGNVYLFRLRDYKSASLDYTRAIEIDPTAEAYNNRAISYTLLKDLEKATEDARKACELGACNALEFLGEKKLIRE